MRGKGNLKSQNSIEIRIWIKLHILLGPTLTRFLTVGPPSSFSLSLFLSFSLSLFLSSSINPPFFSHFFQKESPFPFPFSSPPKYINKQYTNWKISYIYPIRRSNKTKKLMKLIVFLKKIIYHSFSSFFFFILFLINGFFSFYAHFLFFSFISFLFFSNFFLHLFLYSFFPWLFKIMDQI